MRKQTPAFGWTKVTPIVVIAVIAAACGTTASGPLSPEDYAAEMQDIEEDFQEASDEVSSEDHSGYPLETQLIFANDLFVAFQDRLEAWKALNPPAELAEAHQALVAALDEVQHYVGEYLQKASLEGGFEFDDIVAQEHIVGSLDEAFRACTQLWTAVRDLTGTPISFAQNCNF